MGLLVFFYLIILGLVIWLDWYLAQQFYEAARDKGYNDKKYMWICFWLGAVGYLLVIALPDRGNSLAAISDALPEL